MNIIEFFKNLFFPPKVPFYGITDSDFKSISKTGQIYEFREVVAEANIPKFNGVNNDGSVRKFPYQYQNGSSACVAFTTAKIATILYYLLKGVVVKFSPGFFYTQRSNRPQGGMHINDIVKIASTKGCLPADLMPSEGLSESAMNALKVEQYQYDVADAFKLPDAWVELPLNFDTIASTAEATKKPIMVWYAFGPTELFGTIFPKILNNMVDRRHAMTLKDTGRRYGESCHVLEDSADKETWYEKFINRDFFKKCILARYPINFRFAIDNFVELIYTGSVTSLQEILQAEGFYPANLPCTGYFGAITKESLAKFQKAHGISPALGVWGPITKAYLLANYK